MIQFCVILSDNNSTHQIALRLKTEKNYHAEFGTYNLYMQPNVLSSELFRFVAAAYFFPLDGQ